MRARRVLLVIVAALGLSGGSLGPVVSRQALDSNTAIETAADAQLPRFLTSQPSFDVAAPDTQEFTRGVEQPVDPEAVQFMLDHGVPQQMVLDLLLNLHKAAGAIPASRAAQALR